MGLRARFSVVEDLGYPAHTPELGIPIDYSDGCRVFADTWLDAATDMVPVDTGYLQSTLKAESDGDGCTCETLCDYAQYVEYGTIKMGAQPYFEPAIDIALGEATPAWNEAYQEAMDEEQEILNSRAASKGGGGGGGIPGSLGQFLGMILAAIVIGFFRVMLDIATGGGGSHGGSGDSVGGGDIDVEII